MNSSSFIQIHHTFYILFIYLFIFTVDLGYAGLLEGFTHFPTVLLN